jgi:hypothetical protein
MTSFPVDERTAAIGIVVPVHDEEQTVLDCLEAIESSIMHPTLRGVRCRVAIVLDSCHDSSESIVRAWRRRAAGCTSSIICCKSRNVGLARLLGCAEILNTWSELDLRSIWLATTDADSQVPPEWLAVQLRRNEQGCDLWAGRVAVLDWSSRNRSASKRWGRRYALETDPVHGASLGINGATYTEAGGFLPVCTGEDRLLYHEVRGSGAVICHDTLAPVVTSARRTGRAPDGFADHLSKLEAEGVGA